MRRFILVFSLILLIFTVTTHAEPAKTKVVLGVSSLESQSFSMWLPNFEQAYPNIEIEMKAVEYANYHTTLFMDAVTGHDAPDVAVVDISYIPAFAHHGNLCDLLKPPFNAGILKPYFASYKWAQASIDDGRQIGIPFDTNTGGAYYRRDIFKAAGVNIDEIKTMDDLFAAAKKITADTDGDGKIDRWFIANAGEIATMILSSDPDQQLYFDPKGNCIAGKDRIRLAFAWAQKFHQAGLDAGLAEWTSNWYYALNKGTVAYQPSGSYLEWFLRNIISPGADGQWGVAKFPALKAGERPMACGWGGNFLVIPEQCQHKTEAWTFVQFACANRDTQLASFKLGSILPAYMPAWDDPVFTEKIEYFAGQRVRSFWLEIANAAPGRITNRNDDTAETIVNSELNAVLKDGKNIDQALRDAKIRIEEAIKG